MTLISCIYFWSMVNGIDPAVTNAVISVESNNNSFAVSSDRKDYGLMQIRKKFVPYTKIQLLNSCTNVMVGTGILRKAKLSCKKCLDRTWINAYNLGTTGAKRLRYPKKWRYYKKIIAELKE